MKVFLATILLYTAFGSTSPETPKRRSVAFLINENCRWDFAPAKDADNIKELATTIAQILSQREEIISNYLLLSFRDHVINPIKETTSNTQFQTILRDINIAEFEPIDVKNPANNEYFANAMKHLLLYDKLSSNPLVYIIVPDSSFNESSLPDVLRLIIAKKAEIILIAADPIARMEHVTEDMDPNEIISIIPEKFRDIVLCNNGISFHSHTDSIPSILNMINITSPIYPKRTTLFEVRIYDTCLKQNTRRIYNFTVPKNVKEMTIAASGKYQTLSLQEPDKEKVQIFQVSIKESSKVHVIKNPTPGLWSMFTAKNVKYFFIRVYVEYIS